MQSSQITWGKLPFRNLKHYRYRSLGLFLVAFLLSAITFGAGMVSLNLSQGLSSVKERLGADIMIVPSQFEQSAKDIYLCGGKPSGFLLPDDVADLVASVPGVERVTTQTYIASLMASCCEVRLQIIGIDPDTDFVIKPWIQATYSRGLQDGELVAGSKVQINAQGKIRLFNYEFPVSARLAPTGTNLDSSVFANLATTKILARQAEKVGHPVLPADQIGHRVSAVMVKVKPDYAPEDVAQYISKSPQLKGLGFVSANGISSRLKEGVGHIVGALQVFLIIFWAVSLAVLVTVNWVSVMSRSKELGSLRIMGATRTMLTGMLLKENLLASLAGGVLGLGLSAVLLRPFGNAIQRALKQPYLQSDVWSQCSLGGLILVTVCLSAVLASIVSAIRLLQKETYQVVREGQ
ncbi:ABC transporter permease [uncultured Mobiluncus sp.]|uniref:ABC transporter permease n=1 Tax=uncultured Mobiluncus sp. TaxID=293425 RepID=UPI0025F80F6F|nr:ABC transporter permease [uncultured Mobiluncus sp.]